ncbi:MAG: ABC transporter ATP-binding protein [Chloroflexi bacterium]|nr:ABC transporter ATP-binding protein [Chloroflexota bacterium]
MTTATDDRIASAKIALHGISKEFVYKGRTLPVLESVDFYAQEGEVVSVIGPSGCGKSTLLNIIAGLEEPSGGTLWLNGVEARRPLGQVGYMHQKDLLLPWRTVLDNTLLGLEVQGIAKVKARSRALELMERFGLKGFEREYPYALSGGMRQRAAFLRAVLTGKDVLLLDEPFGALDALTRAQMQEWLLELWSAFRKTIVLVTHDVEEALFLSDRVYLFSARPGRVRLMLAVDLPRPRTHLVVTQEPFITYKAQLLAALGKESTGVQEEPWR